MSVITEEIGRVSIVPKGDWNSQNTYTKLDIVGYNGSSYIAKQDVPANTSLNNTDYWKLIAEKGTSISGVRKTGTNALTDTYTIDFTNGTNTTFNVKNGNSISTITKTETSADGLTDTYTINFTDQETTATFQVKNGNGIASITKTGTSADGLIDTYTITFEDGTSTTFYVNNGVGISSITGPVSNGLTDTYTINFTNGAHKSFNIQNAKSISSITPVDVTGESGHTDTYDINFNDDSTPFRLEIYNGRNGDGSVSTVDGISSDGQGNVETLIVGEGPPTTSTVGKFKQRYYDLTNKILYICTSADTSSTPPVYTWQSTGVSVDNQLDVNSENPVQNAVLTEKIGTKNLTTDKKNLIDAVNYIDVIVKGQSTTKLNTDVVVASWDPTAKQYYKGDYILYNTKLYRCVESYNSTFGNFDSSKWQPITVTTELAGLTNNVQSSLEKAGTAFQLGLTSASVGDLARVAEVDADGKPTEWKNASLDEIKINPNLLDNWYFVGGGSQKGEGLFPINRNQKIAYNIGNNENWTNIFDRWTTSGEQVEIVESKGVRLSYQGSSYENYIFQRINHKLPAGTYTLSVLFKENSGVVALSAVIPTLQNNKPSNTEVNSNISTKESGLLSVTYIITETDAEQAKTRDLYQRIHVTSNAIIEAAKLEYGEQQTLAHKDKNNKWVLNELPNYQIELIKCHTPFGDSIMYSSNLSNVGIVVNGKQSSIPASTGQYIILKNSTIENRPDGLYTAEKTIQANTDIDESYLSTAILNGGLNNILAKIGEVIKVKTVYESCESLYETQTKQHDPNDPNDTENHIPKITPTVDPGYKYLTWLRTGFTQGWISSFPILIEPVGNETERARVFWNGALPEVITTANGETKTTHPGNIGAQFIEILDL